MRAPQSRYPFTKFRIICWICFWRFLWYDEEIEHKKNLMKIVLKSTQETGSCTYFLLDIGRFSRRTEALKTFRCFAELFFHSEVEDIPLLLSSPPSRLFFSILHLSRSSLQDSFQTCNKNLALLSRSSKWPLSYWYHPQNLLRIPIYQIPPLPLIPPHPIRTSQPPSQSSSSPWQCNKIPP